MKPNLRWFFRLFSLLWRLNFALFIKVDHLFLKFLFSKGSLWAVQKRVFFGCFCTTEPLVFSSFHHWPGSWKSNILDLFCYLRNFKSTGDNRGLVTFHSSFRNNDFSYFQNYFFTGKTPLKVPFLSKAPTADFSSRRWGPKKRAIF